MSTTAQTELGTTSGYMSTKAVLTNVCCVAVAVATGRLTNCYSQLLYTVQHRSYSVEDSHSTADRGPLRVRTFMKQAQIAGYWMSTVCVSMQ